MLKKTAKNLLELHTAFKVFEKIPAPSKVDWKCLGNIFAETKLLSK